MNKLVIAIAVCVLALSISSCATTYKQAEKDSAHALVELNKGYKNGHGFGRATMQEYSVVDNLTCDNAQRLAHFTWMDGKQKTKRVAVGSVVHITGAITEITTSSMSIVNGTPVAILSGDACFSVASFTPKNGQTYSVLQENSGVEKCSITVVNTETNISPDDLKIENGTSCMGIKRQFAD